MACNNIQIELIDLLENRLSGERTVVVSNHINSCPHCAGQFEFIKKTYGLIDEEKEMPVNPFFYAKVKARLDAQLSPEIKLKGWIQWLKPIGIAASILLGFYIGNGEVLLQPEETIDTQLAEEILLPAEYEDMLLTFSD